MVTIQTVFRANPLFEKTAKNTIIIILFLKMAASYGVFKGFIEVFCRTIIEKNGSAGDMAT